MDNKTNSTRMPVLFLAHGSPMNAIDDNDFTRSLSRLGTELPRPKALLVISAHWVTSGTRITAMDPPPTIHDFFGFPQPLFEIQYPAPGSPELAERVRKLLSLESSALDQSEWGLDHGTWSVLRHVYPQADLPVVQLSLPAEASREQHLQLGRLLSPLRDEGVLIVGSGNLVHNLRRIRWEKDAPAWEWAEEFDLWTKEKLLARDQESLALRYKDSLAGQLSVPTDEHYLPLLYILGASRPEDELEFCFEGLQNASISMRSFKLG